MNKLFLIVFMLMFFISISFAGNAGLIKGEPLGVTVGSTTTEVVAVNSKREYLALVNDSDETIYIAFSADAVINKGIRLNANGGAVVWRYPTVPFGVVNAICASGSKNLAVHTGE